MPKGLVKAKKYDWRDTNLALFGSDTEKQVKKESAESEPAWQGVGQEVGLKIWRIVKFQVTDWPTEDYGKFYSGDSYIVLNTYKPNPDSEELAYDVHFWIGSRSTQDEYGTAAYKTVELDTYLDDKAVQHREVQGHESKTFLSYFKSIVIMEGGAESGFRHVAPEEYTPRLLHFCGTRKNIQVKEVPLCQSRLNAGDVFILDLGTTLYQWNGKESNKDERFKAMQYLSEVKSERGDAHSETLDQDDVSSNHKFFESLVDDDEDDEDHLDGESIRELYRVSDESGSLEISKIKDAEVDINDFIRHKKPIGCLSCLGERSKPATTKDVFILDCGNAVYVWVGGDASPAEKKNGFAYAQKHLAGSTHALVPISVIKQGQHNAEFEIAIAA